MKYEDPKETKRLEQIDRMVDKILDLLRGEESLSVISALNVLTQVMVDINIKIKTNPITMKIVLERTSNHYKEVYEAAERYYKNHPEEEQETIDGESF